MQRERTPDHVLFLPEGIVRQARAAAGQLLRRKAGQRRQNGGRRRGVADAHLADADGLHTVLRGALRLLHADGNGRQRLLPRHGGLPRDIAGGAADLPIHDLRAADIRVDADVRHDDGIAKGRRQGGHARDMPCHIDRLTERDRDRRCRNALGRNAVIRREHEHAAAVDPIFHPAGQSCQPDGDILQRAEAARRLGQLRLTAGGSVHRGAVRRADGAQKGLKFLLCHGSSR